MKRFLVFIFVIGSILSGCGNNEVSFSEVSLVKAGKNVKEFIEHIEATENGEGNGIYMFNDSEKVSYLYLTQALLESGNGFGSLEIKVEENSLNIYLSEDSDSTGSVDKYKLYKIKIDGEHEYMKVFKNGVETHLQIVGA